MALDANKITAQVASLLDATLLQPQSIEADFRELCIRARKYNVRCGCVSPAWLPLVVQELTGTKIMPVAVVGFPNGTTSTPAKIYEAQWGEGVGAAELDMVVNLGHVKGGDWNEVQRDVEGVISA